jgi:DNA-binding response OmpR family regulator
MAVEQPGKAASAPRHILVIEGSSDMPELYEDVLRDEAGFEVTITDFRPHMLDYIKSMAPDLIISDYLAGREKAGVQLLQKLKMDRETANIPVIICSTATKELKELEGYLAGKDVSLIYRPFGVGDLVNAVQARLN